jgi:hypothetical protein
VFENQAENAVGTQGIISYRLMPDPLLQSEISPRLYRRVSFAAPDMAVDIRWAAALEARQAAAGDRAGQGGGKVRRRCRSIKHGQSSAG